MTNLPGSRFFVFFVFMLLFLFLGEFYLFAWSGTQHRNTGYAITRQTNELKELLARQRALEIEVAVLKSPRRIGRIAKERIGLKPPAQNQIIMLR